MRTITAASLLSLAALAGPAHADFTGPFAPPNWTVTTTGTLTGSGTNPGSATFTAPQLTLVSGNTTSPVGDVSCVGGSYGLAGPCEVRATISVPGTFSFHWSYLTADDTGPAGDIFGAIVDGTRVQLSDPGGPLTQSGDASFAASSSFGWFMNCSDCIGGAATATVTDFGFARAIPEPETSALLLAGIAALAVAARRKRSRV